MAAFSLSSSLNQPTNYSYTMKLLSYQSDTLYVVLVVFTLLNSLLWYLCADYVPRRDVGAGLLAFSVLLLLPKKWFVEKGRPKLKFESNNNNNNNINNVQRFHRLFALLSSLEVIVTILIPWLLILRHEQHAWRYLLTPHLFVFQSQIALEALVTFENAVVVFWYTFIANMYRAVALLTWLQRTRQLLHDGDGWHPAIAILPAFATVLWIASNFYIWKVWFPLLRQSEQQPKDQVPTEKKQA
jgi:hypothetical protein